MLVPVLLEILAWYIEGEEYSVSRAPAMDRVHLALVFERSLDGFVAVVAPAIVTVNLVHALANRAVNAWEPTVR
ncbi:hypothetical protein [Nonomuraea sp. LPB2021202275-12-8]|uniref:hypothetical protein n=1 Tax=Nonomuraea sp. LPB2021202275-12-8 TaxID=3120159 RepID=UPI00300C7192